MRLFHSGYTDPTYTSVNGTPYQFFNYNELGSGCYSRVFKAINLLTGELVAVKQVNHDLSQQIESNPAFYAYIKGCNIDGTIIPEDMVVIQEEGKLTEYYQVMPLASFGNGLKLQQALSYLDKDKREALLMVIAFELTEILLKLHENKIYHIDFKPENILISLAPSIGENTNKEHYIFLADFDCAKIMISDSKYFQLLSNAGDAKYWTPEHRSSTSTVRVNSYPYLFDKKSKADKKQLLTKMERALPFDSLEEKFAAKDLWGLGVTLFSLLSVGANYFVEFNLLCAEKNVSEEALANRSDRLRRSEFSDKVASKIDEENIPKELSDFITQLIDTDVKIRLTALYNARLQLPSAANFPKTEGEIASLFAALGPLTWVKQYQPTPVTTYNKSFYTEDFSNQGSIISLKK